MYRWLSLIRIEEKGFFYFSNFRERFKSWKLKCWNSLRIILSRYLYGVYSIRNFYVVKWDRWFSESMAHLEVVPNYLLLGKCPKHLWKVKGFFVTSLSCFEYFKDRKLCTGKNFLQNEKFRRMYFLLRMSIRATSLIRNRITRSFNFNNKVKSRKKKKNFIKVKKG